MTLHAQKLRQFILALESLESNKSDITAEIRGKLLEAKSEGFDPKILRKLVQERKKKPDEVQEEQEILKLYRSALSCDHDASPRALDKPIKRENN